VAVDVRALFVQTLTGVEALNALFRGNDDWLYQRNSFPEEAPPHERPFAVYSFGVEDRAALRSMPQHRVPIELWVHDVRGDYFRIDQILDRAVEVLEAVPHGDGFVEFHYNTRSRDFEDLDLKTILRFGTFEAIYSRSEEDE
jgi:hypothetical protein